MRGYLIQAVICLLNSLEYDNEWVALDLEPDIGSDKVDIAWCYSDDQVRVAQVKSSQNLISKPQVERWARGLEDKVIATHYELILIGPCSQAVVNLTNIGKVQVPTPKVLNIKSLLGEAAHVLGKYLEKTGFESVSNINREILVLALVTQLEAYTLDEPITRDDFDNLLGSWIAEAVSQLETGKEKTRKKTTELQWLHSLLDGFYTIRMFGFHHSEFQAWHSETKLALREIFGQDSYIVQDYDRIAWRTSERPEEAEEQTRLFSTSLTRANGVLVSAIKLREKRP